MSERLVLPSVQIVMVGGVESLLDEVALRESCAKVMFGDGLYMQCDPGAEAYNDALWYKVPLTLNEKVSHVLIIQYDSWVLDVSLWHDDWLEYDYIGAPWPWYKDGLQVGNGGFSLRSKWLMQFLADNRSEFPVRHPEDDTLCRHYRPTLEANGFRWAPEPVARSFSFERGEQVPTFGFHGIFNFPKVLSKEKLEERIALATDYAKSKLEWKELNGK